jgi:regulator of sigma E protease
MDLVLTILTVFLIFLVLVLIHEFGHFIAAKRSGVYVEEFGFGFPPRLFGKKIGETLYSVNLIPIGGFVKLYQEEYHEEDKVENKSGIPKGRGFIHKKPWQKTLIITAGVVMNFLLGWAIISYLFTTGITVPNGIEINEIQKNSPAQKVGLKQGDKLLQVLYNGKERKLESSYELIQSAKEYAGREITIVVGRGTQTIPYQITPRANPPEGQGSLGIIIKQIVKKETYPWYTAPWYGLIEVTKTTKQIVVEILKIPIQLITTQKTNVEFSGPIGIGQVVDQARKFGFKAILEITALLSLNLAVFNILPFPALDGGRLVFVIYEWITGKKSNQTLERYMNLTGIIILLSLSALVTINDIRKIW